MRVQVPGGSPPKEIVFGFALLPPYSLSAWWGCPAVLSSSLLSLLRSTQLLSPHEGGSCHRQTTQTRLPRQRIGIASLKATQTYKVMLWVPRADLGHPRCSVRPNANRHSWTSLCRCFGIHLSTAVSGNQDLASQTHLSSA